MKLKSPIVLLVAGAALAAGLLGANLGSSDAGDAVTAASSPPAQSPSGPPPSASAPASAAPVAPPAIAVATYAGTVNGGGSLAVVVKGSRAVAYLCDGRNESWLSGTADGSDVTARNTTNDTLSATRGAGRLTGSLTVNGRSWTFALPTVKKPSGLYRATAQIRGAEVVGGWVVLPDGRQVGVLRRGGTTTGPAPAIDPVTGAVTVDGTRITASAPDPAVTLDR
jgi:serine/threonine-protein kinase